MICYTKQNVFLNEAYFLIPSFFNSLNVNFTHQKLYSPPLKNKHVFTSKSTKRAQIPNHHMPLAPEKETDCDLTVSLKFPTVILHETKSPIKARDSQIARSLAIRKKYTIRLFNI